MSTPEQNKDLIRRFMAVFSTGDIAGILSLMDPEATYWVAGTMPISGTHSREAFAKLHDQVIETCTGPIVLKPTVFTTEDNRVAVETESLTHTKSGRTYSNHYHFLFEIRDDKILSVCEYLDTMHANAILCTP